MYFADRPRDSADSDRAPEARTSHRAENEVIVERTPVVADAAPDDNALPSSGMASERRRVERRRIDRMSTGI
jgi:hypothetical protein